MYFTSSGVNATNEPLDITSIAGDGENAKSSVLCYCLDTALTKLDTKLFECRNAAEQSCLLSNIGFESKVTMEWIYPMDHQPDGTPLY